jgi:hypothetical protein
MNNDHSVAIACALVLTVCPLALLGCVEGRPEFARVSSMVVSHLEGDCELEMQFSVGPVGLSLSRWVIGENHDEEGVDEALKHVSHLEVGIFTRRRDNANGFGVLKAMETEMRENGWKSLLLSCKDGEITAVYCRMQVEECMKRLLVLNSSDDQIVLVEVEGDLASVIHSVMNKRRFEI